MPSQKLKKQFGQGRFYITALFLLGASFVLGYVVDDTIEQQQLDDLAVQRQTVAQLNSENHRLTRQLNILTVELEVERQANRQTQQDLQQVMKDTQQIREELSFYQKVLAPELSESGFVIDSGEVQALNDNSYRLSVVLMQQEKRRSFVKGRLQIRVHGDLDGQAMTLQHKDLGIGELNFQFRYFQALETVLTLPRGFEASNLDIQASVTQRRGKKDVYTQTFAWKQ